MIPHERHLLLGLLAFLIAFSLGYFWFLPTLKAYGEHRLAVAARTEELANLDQRKALLVRYDAVIKEHQARLNRLALAVPTEADYPELLSQTKSLVEENGLILTNFQPARGSAQAGETLVTMTIRGTYPKLVTFAEQLEKNLRPARIQSVNLVRSGQTATVNDLAATFQIRFIRIPEGGHQ